MPATEDSVLTSLNELRRLRKERQKKGHSGRGAGARSHKPAASARDPMGDQVTPPPRSDLPVAKGPRQGGQAFKVGLPTPGVASAPMAATWNIPPEPAAFAQMARPTSSAKPAIIVAVVLLGAAGAGYMKLQNDTQALMAEKEATIRRVEEARAQAVEEAAKTERQAQVKLKACEAAKTESASAAKAPAVPAAAVAIAPASSAPTVASSSSSSRSRHRATGGRRAAAAVAAPAPAPEPTVPKLPNKKKLDNDPLAGIKI